MRCAPNPACLGFNYRTKSNEYVVNCQLSTKAQKRENDQSKETGMWTFYQDVSKTVYDRSIGTITSILLIKITADFDLRFQPVYFR